VENDVATINELRAAYLRFFEQRRHLVYTSASVKSDDPSLMFTSAGMVQFKPYFLGATPKFAGVSGVWHRVATAQKCLRINDIENVGRTLRHHSFFEMLGNFSFGDYFKKEAARWAWEFITSPEWLGLDPDRLYVTIYQDDDEAFEVWTKHVGVDPSRVSRWGEDENFWPANAVSEGPNGPCGPCSEIFYDRGPEFGSPDETGPNTGSGDRYIEFWNLVFTQFDRRDGGELEPLPQQNIDTGLGFERLVAVMTGSEDAYATALFQPTIQHVARLSGVPYRGVESVSHRVIADHVRAVSFAIADGVLPANDGPGYVVKMLLRRASRHAWLLGLHESVLHTLVDDVIHAMGEAYPELVDGRDRVQGILRTEEEQFLRTLASGIERVGDLLDGLEGEILDGATAFDLWQTYGFPLDLTQEMAAERGIGVDEHGYEQARELARDASRGEPQGKALFTAAKDALGPKDCRRPSSWGTARWSPGPRCVRWWWTGKASTAWTRGVLRPWCSIAPRSTPRGAVRSATAASSSGTGGRRS
jgi:alanyl-tRNA synthetase